MQHPDDSYIRAMAKFYRERTWPEPLREVSLRNMVLKLSGILLVIHFLTDGTPQSISFGGVSMTAPNVANLYFVCKVAIGATWAAFFFEQIAHPWRVKVLAKANEVECELGEVLAETLPRASDRRYATAFTKLNELRKLSDRIGLFTFIYPNGVKSICVGIVAAFAISVAPKPVCSVVETFEVCKVPEQSIVGHFLEFEWLAN